MFCHKVVGELIRHGITRQSVPHFPNYLRFLYHQMLPDGRSRLQMQYEVCLLFKTLLLAGNFKEVCKCLHTSSCRVPIGCTKLPVSLYTYKYICKQCAFRDITVRTSLL